MTSRRSFLARGTGALAGAAFLPLPVVGCGLPTRPAGRFSAEGVLLGVYDVSLQEAVPRALAQLDLSWLNPGDTVLVKVACNSGRRHPSVTAPGAVRGLCAALLSAGAGRVIVADQAGVEHVRLAPGNQRYGSTRALMGGNGLLDAIEGAGAEAVFFDEADYDGGYFAASVPAGSAWSAPLMLPRVIEEADHIVYLPRLSSHILCGYTHGLKVAMGWLRDDSRFHVHHDAEAIYEKYVDISYTDAVASRLRLIVTAVDKVLLDAGPDVGTIAELDASLVIASPHLANHDAVSVAALLHYDRLTPRGEGIGAGYGLAASTVNRYFLGHVEEATGIPWSGATETGYRPYTPHRFQRGVRDDRALRRAYAVSGGLPAHVPVRLDGVGDALRDALADYARGLLETEP